MTTKVALHLSFETDQSKKVRVSIANPKQPVDSTLVDAAVQAIVSKNVFSFPQGKVVSSNPSQEVQTDTTAIS